MGCSQSKIENEEAVARCKERKHFMKEAVSARNAFAAAHSSYATYLKNTGGALSDFSQGEVQNPQFGPPSIHNPPAPIQPPFEIIPPPPPPPQHITPAPLHRAATMPEMTSKPQLEPVGTIMEEDEGDNELENDGALNSRSRRRRSNRNSGGSSRGATREMVEEDDEEDARPPAPPPLSKSKPVTQFETNHHMPPPHPAWEDYFFPQMENTPGTSLGAAEEVSINKEEIERKEFNEKPNIVRGRHDEVPEPVPPPAKVVEPPPAPPQEAMMLSQNGKISKKVKQGQVSMAEGKLVKQKVNVIQIFSEIDEHFLKASESAHEVSKMLEATRLHYHSNFADNRGHIDHSARVMRVITWNRSFRGMPNMDDGGKDDFDFEGHETHATILDKLLAWEKKLYDEVKAGELMKFEYQRKVASLNKLKKRGKSSDSLERAKAAVSHLHTRYIVDMQSLDSTVAEINRLRDQHLFPRLVQLVDGMVTMWGIMHAHHEKQSNLALMLASMDDSQSPKLTTEHHHERTGQLLIVVQEWHSQFEKLMSYQRKYIKALNNWLKLNLVPIESNLKEKVSSPPRIMRPPIQRLLLAWQEFLEKLPDEVARTALSNFSAVIDTILCQQEEELQLKHKCKETEKELDRKTRHFEDWYRKYMERKIPDDPDPDKPHGIHSHDEVVTEKQFVVDQVRKRLEDEKEAYERICQQVRQKSLVSLRNRLPELFRKMSDFALQCSKMYSELRYISQNLNTGQSSE